MNRRAEELQGMQRRSWGTMVILDEDGDWYEKKRDSKNGYAEIMFLIKMCMKMTAYWNLPVAISLRTMAAR